MAVSLVMALLMGLFPTSVAAEQDQWVWRSPLPQGNSLFAIAYGNGVFVAVGPFGTIITSSDGGKTWTMREAGTTESLATVLFAEGQFMALGTRGTVVTSKDGFSWNLANTNQPTRGKSPTEPLFQGAAYGAAGYVALASHDPNTGTQGVFTSTDGRSWSEIGLQRNWTDPRNVVFAEGMYWAVDDALWASADGQAWHAVTRGDETYGADSLAAAGDTLVLVGGSMNGTGVTYTRSGSGEWTKKTHQYPLIQATFGGGRFVAVGRQLIATSRDGYHWNETKVDPVLYGIAFGEGYYVAVGESGSILRSTDGLAWEEVVEGAWAIEALAFGAGRFVGVNSVGRVFTSDDGVAWVRHENGPQNVETMTYANGVFVAAGGEYGFENGSVYTSTNGLVWEQRYSTGPRFRDVSYGAGTWVVVGDYDVLYSRDNGVTWKEASSPPVSSLATVAYGDGQWVALDIRGEVYSSVDGDIWHESTGTDGHGPMSSESLIYAAGRFVAVSDYGSVVTSPNGKSWTGQRLPDPLYQVFYANGQFIAVGGHILWTGQTPLQRDIYADAVYVSTDAQTWTQVPIRQSGPTRAVAYGHGRFVLAGYGGILASRTGVLAGRVCGRFVDLSEFSLQCSALQQERLAASVSGYPDGTFRSDGKVTRAEFVKMLVLSLDRVTEGGSQNSAPPFPDMGSHWAAPYVARALSNGWVRGFPDGQFRPDAPLTRAEVAQVLTAAKHLPPGNPVLYSDVTRADWYGAALGALETAHKVGDSAAYPVWTETFFGATLPVTRGEAVLLIANMLSGE